MTELEELGEKIDRIAKVVDYTCKLSKKLRRAHNRVTEVFNKNFEVFEEDIKRNSTNIDKMVRILEELVGNAAEYDKKHANESINFDSRMMFL